MKSNILFIYAHIDDETINSYGTMRYFLKSGWNVTFSMACIGASSEDSRKRLSAISKLETSINHNVFGCTSYFPNMFMTLDLNLTEIIAREYVETVINNVKPEIVFTHHYNDLHRDHRLINEAVTVACRHGSGVQQLYLSHSNTQAWTNQPITPPNTYVDITEHIEKKKYMLSNYKDLLKEGDDARSPESIIDYNRYLGSLAGFTYAEAYTLAFQRGIISTLGIIK